MLERFPTFHFTELQWSSIYVDRRPDQRLIAAAVAAHFDSPAVIMDINRRMGRYLPIDEAAEVVCDYVGSGNIRIADPTFKAFMVIASAGMVASWRA
jgi:hypothetical protein